MDEILMTVYYGIVRKGVGPYSEILDKKTVQLLESGLSALWINEILHVDGIKRGPEDIGPQVLTLEHLAIGFIFWLIPLALTIPVFLLELAISRVLN